MPKKIKHKIIKGIELKRCGSCLEWKLPTAFHKNKSRWDSLNNQCKECIKKQYFKDIKKTRKQQKEKRIKQKNYFKQYRLEHTEQQKQYKKQYNINKSKQLKKYNKQYYLAPAIYNTYALRLNLYEDIRRTPNDFNILQVKCAYCGKWLSPTNSEVQSRIAAINGTVSGELRFYCSENCKTACPIFNQVLWPKGFKKATSREVVPLLRQLVLKRDDYTCQKCWLGAEEVELHVHHEKSYTLNKIMANDPDNCIALCKSCHKEIHKQEGCRYSDLKCKEI